MEEKQSHKNMEERENSPQKNTQGENGRNKRPALDFHATTQHAQIRLINMPYSFLQHTY